MKASSKSEITHHMSIYYNWWVAFLWPTKLNLLVTAHSTFVVECVTNFDVYLETLI